jgi:hypothetical protein
MPKKTKREKILARARRIIREQSSNPPDLPAVTPNQVSVPHTVNPYSFKPAPVSSLTYKQTDDDIREFAAIRRDLIKTIILSAAAVIVEIILYSSVFKNNTIN